MMIGHDCRFNPHTSSHHKVAGSVTLTLFWMSGIVTCQVECMRMSCCFLAVSDGLHQNRHG